jgi:RNA polymerase sigma factor FliA
VRTSREQAEWHAAHNGDIDARNRIVESYMPLVRYVAIRVKAGLPPHVQLVDLMTYGSQGLIGAVARYDLDRGVRFEAFAVRRIRGAILDELRAQDWVPRRVRRMSRDVETALEILHAELGRRPNRHELAAALELSLPELQALMAEVESAAPHLSLEAPTDEGGTIGDIVTQAPVTEEHAFEADHRARLADAIGYVSGQARVMISLHYFEDATFADIARLLGVTESRVFQIHADAIREMRVLSAT